MAQEGAVKEQTLPEVPLRWSDFVWSLERLRHKPYGKKMREKDWFRINPLEMVILGCQTLATGAPASRDHGTLMLVMEPLRREMRSRPRYWQRLLTVLAKTSQGDSPSLILQRCCSSFIAIWKCLKEFSEIRPFIYGWAITDLKVGELLQQLLSERGRSLGVELSSEAQQLVNEIQQLQVDAREHVERLLASEAESSSGLEGSSGSLLEVLRLVLQECGRGREGIVSAAVAIQLHLITTEFEDSKNVPQQLDIDSLQQLLSSLRESSSDFETAVCHLLSILQLISVRSDELQLPQEPTNEDREDPEKSDDDEAEKSSDPGSPDPLDTAPETQLGADIEGGAPNQPPLPGGLLSALSDAVQKWREMAGHQREASAPSDVPCKLLSLAAVILAAKPLSESLPEATDFFQWPAAVLMAYSTEGYLSDSPHEFLVELLEFVASLAEQGTPPIMALQTNLPNLFGPVFGIRSHAVSCKLLEYGYLAVCSQHQKSLLTEGLQFLMKVFHLFPPIDEVRAHTQARLSHLEALEISHSIVDDLLASLLPGEDNTGTTPSGETASPEKEEAAPGPDVSPLETTAHIESPQEDSSPAKQEGEGHQLEVVSDIERDIDKQARLAILLRLFKLACAMIRNGDNTSFLYASILPKLFQQSQPEVQERFNKSKLKKFFGEDPPPPASGISWNVDKKKLALQLLDLTILSAENDIATPFQLCGIVVPKLVKNLDRMRFSDEEKLTLTIDVIKITQETLENGHNIDELISHGIDLLSNLLPESASGDELRQFIGQMARQFVTSSHSSLLFLIKNACHFMRNNFPDESEGVQQLFRTLIYRGKRDEIRGVFRVCKDPLKKEEFAPLRQYLYSFASGTLSHRQLVALCELLITAMDLGRPQQVVREIQTMVVGEEDDKGEVVGKREQERVIGKLTAPCLHQLEEALRENRFKKEVWESISAQLSRIALFRTLFQEEIASLSDLSTEELLETFRSKFPQEILSSEDTMQLLALCATRIEHMQSPRFDSLKTLLSRILRYFLTLPTGTEAPPTDPTPITMETSRGPSSSMEGRIKGLSHFLFSLPRNMEDRKKLLECGYGSRLWEEKFSLTVKTDGSHSLEENMRQTLLACYSEFSDILKQMAITHVSVDGEMVKVSDLFGDELSLTDLKGRRAIAVRVIDERLGRAKEGHFYERKVALLAKEDDIEADFDKQAKAPVKPKTFTVAVNTTFFDCARCCGSQIIGCYVPTGEHCERPLEVGMRDDSAIASIYDESGMEIENLEILFTEEGAYFFKAYSNGHPYDTSQVWVSLFTSLLKEPSLVPSIIIPKGYPNQRTWEALRRCVSTELTGSILTCRHNFSPEWRTYYDHRPEKIRLGMDIVLHPGFTLTDEQSKHHLHRQRSRLTKDLAGLIFEAVMQDLLEDEWLNQFKFLGKAISQYISVCIREGERKPETINKGFDYERWKKAYSKMKEPPSLPGSLASLAPPPADIPGALPTKEQLVQHLIEFIDAGIVQWCTTADLEQLCITSHKQLLEMKGFLEKTKRSTEYHSLKPQLKQLRELLAQCIFVVPVLSFPEPLQEEAMHWIFQNEDRVWRYRGGRDGHETLQQFMSFLGKGPREKGEGEGGRGRGRGRGHQESYAGVLVFCLPHALETGRDVDDVTTVFQVPQLVGYAVGEVPRLPAMGDDTEGVEVEQKGAAARWRPLDQDCYEIVTAWVHPSYRGLNLSVQMYLEIVKHAPARLVMCDMLQGSVERIILSNWLLRLLNRIGMGRIVFQKRQMSYTVITQTGVTEQFEQVVFSVRPLRVALRVYNVARWLRTHPLSTAVAAAAVVTIPIMVYSFVKV